MNKLEAHYTAATSIVDWTKSESYHNSFLIAKDDVLDFAVKNCIDHGLPDIAVGATQGKLLNLIARSIGAKRILEVGTLGGYSTIWMGRALPDEGTLISLEIDEKHVKAGLEDKCKITVGPAGESMENLHPDVPFDLIFIDADKASYPKYFTEAKRLVKKGGVILVDNVVFFGLVSDLSVTDEDLLHFVDGTRQLLADLKGDMEIEATTIATVGERGFDGFMYIVRK
ncbi:S-adenosyl-L-methionine-dependent methyltransferase [Gymnopus androsaceus JB14]|uniref:S-adenosyl-L-methionine-dependent methyltransferase n=1 Tax=Gymnopus androsaceus JB14 TaxID=1447944 RepID=A0A6A4I515_9AGAR|nr:S-adenosyl-L-methionine-dependent methyltransferase [Gymnopus androsaceus JB14]